MKLLWALAPIGAVSLGRLGLGSLPNDAVIGSFATPLEGRTSSQRHNSTLALERIDGAVIKPGETFSFNKRVGTFSQDAGYRKAPVSYNGTLIDDWGGGVCQTSTTLYNAALLAGMEIEERHRHQFQPSYVPPGRDAAVAFSHIDLKFKNPYSYPVRVTARLTSGMVRIELIGAQPLSAAPQVFSDVLSSREPWSVHVQGARNRVRNTGRAGWEVAVYRRIGNRTEMISKDTYPVMHRVYESR
jgi:vancomycin resistance protein YoaR